MIRGVKYINELFRRNLRRRNICPNLSPGKQEKKIILQVQIDSKISWLCIFLHPSAIIEHNRMYISRVRLLPVLLPVVIWYKNAQLNFPCISLYINCTAKLLRSEHETGSQTGNTKNHIIPHLNKSSNLNCLVHTEHLTI